LLVSRNQEDRIMVIFAKWRAGKSFVCIYVWSKGGLGFLSPLVAHAGKIFVKLV
jgi:hypothetical protein